MLTHGLQGSAWSVNQRGEGSGELKGEGLSYVGERLLGLGPWAGSRHDSRQR